VNRRKTDPKDVEVALALVDEWGRGFVAEVDYRLEAKNTMDFIAAMQFRGLNAVTAPQIVDELSTSKVITVSQ
jgi:predicted unusual protein kinase regulating ubiquinone biosynthesis (AarF/ABC1/UbiB family)